MTHKTTMPEPDAVVNGIRVWTHVSMDNYAEAYANAKAREALEAAASAVEQHDKEGREWIHGSLWDVITREATARIRALIPNTK